MKTTLVKNEERAPKWYLVDAEGQTLGRLSSKIVGILRGKSNPNYTPNVDTGDFVIVINAGKIAVSGKKSTNKLYHRHTGFPGGYRSEPFDKLINRIPTRPLEKAIKGMLPHTRLGDAQYTKVKIYADADHPHVAQKPIVIK